MGLFTKKYCCHCGGKVGLILNAKLADGQYICEDCCNKCGSLVSLETFETKVRKEDVPAVMEGHRLRTERAGQFQVTTSILNDQGTGILVDENHGWWIPLSVQKWAVKSPEKSLAKKKPNVFELSQYLGYQMNLDISAQNEDWKKCNKDYYGKLQLPRPDFPTCEFGDVIHDIKLNFTLDDPYVTGIEIWGLKDVKFTQSEEKMASEAYQLADNILTFLEQHRG